MQSGPARIVRKISEIVLPKQFRTRSSLTIEAGWTESFFKKHMSVSQVPILLISQVQRSGGTLLSQLFDGHSQIASYPGELKFGPEVPEDAWPSLDITRGPRDLFTCLHDHRLVRTFREGFTKSDHDPRRFSFICFPTLHQRLFVHACNAAEPRSSRSLFDIYFSTFFIAWLNCRSHPREAKWVTAFAPRLASSERSLEMFFRDYPDGRLIQVLRHPKSWLSSAKGHRRTKKRNLSDADLLHAWSASTASVIRNRQIYGASVIVIPFERLISDTGATMEGVCRELDIEYETTMLTPTFNGEAMIANSSFAVDGDGVMQAPISRGSTEVETGEVSDVILRMHEEASQYAIPLE